MATKMCRMLYGHCMYKNLPIIFEPDTLLINHSGPNRTLWTITCQVTAGIPSTCPQSFRHFEVAILIMLSWLQSHTLVENPLPPVLEPAPHSVIRVIA